MEKTICSLQPVEEVLIGATDGTINFINSRKIFTGGFYVSQEKPKKYFVPPKPEQKFFISKTTDFMTLKKAFSFVEVSMSKVCSTEHQVVEFCEKFEHLIQPIGCHFFFLLNEGEYYAEVQLLRGGLNMSNYPLKKIDHFKWSNNICIVYPG